MPLYLSLDTLEDGRVLGVISDGHPRYGSKKVIVCTVETFPAPLEAARPLAEAWFKKMQIERPWETRQ